MMNQPTNEVERKEIAILKVLSDSSRPLGGRVLAHRLSDLGIDLGERAVRYHLKLMDERGLTRTAGRKDGRIITKSGIEELDSALVADRLGLVNVRIDTLAYQSSFDLEERRGEIPINVSLFPRQELGKVMVAMKEVFLAGFGFGDLIFMAHEGERVGGVMVPLGNLGLATVSHVVVYDILQRAGIPAEPRFGGILQIHNHEILRFVELIEYAGCSLDPSEVFIASGMTSVSKAVREGNGRILASFCEIPALARPKAVTVIKELATAGMNGLIILGEAVEPVFQFPVAANRVGMVLMDGLNPVAAAVEAGKKLVNHAMSGIIDFGKLQHFKECQAIRR
jgi:repressor of nif and glnA expression